jgi:predicted transcriptional regulator
VCKAKWDIPPKFLMVAKPSYPAKESNIRDIEPFLPKED